MSRTPDCNVTKSEIQFHKHSHSKCTWNQVCEAHRRTVRPNVKAEHFCSLYSGDMEKGDSIELSNDCTFLLHGIPQEVDTGRRGKGGVGIALNKLATQSWKEAGSLIIKDFGPRIIATRLKVFDQKNNPCFVFLISAYAPIGVANQLIWDRFLDNLQNCINAKHDTDILVIGCDTNSSMGTCNEVKTTESIPSLGKYGIPYQNAAGIRFLTFLEINHLVATSTYFRKNSYVTWRHPHSKLPYQIDHILVEKSSFCRIINVATVKPVLDTDHLAIFCKLRILYNIRKAIPNKRPLVKLDTDQLCVNKELSTQFNRFVSLDQGLLICLGYA